MYILAADNFLLELFPHKYDEDLIDLNVHVVSNDFSCSITMDSLWFNSLVTFAQDTMALYETLTGSAKLACTFPDSFIEFRAGKRGHIFASGTLSSYTQSLHFENEFDQTFLQPFAKKLFADWKKYLKEENA